MSELHKKMIKEAMAAQHADVEAVKKKRGGNFVIDDAQPYLDAVQKMKPAADQSPSVFQLHTESVKAHFEILKGLTKTIRPEDDPFVEHYQTPVILEILCKEDPKFAKSVETFEAVAQTQKKLNINY